LAEDKVPPVRGAPALLGARRCTERRRTRRPLWFARRCDFSVLFLRGARGARQAGARTRSSGAGQACAAPGAQEARQHGHGQLARPPTCNACRLF